MKYKNIIKSVSSSFLVTILLASCANTPSNKYSPGESYLKEDKVSEVNGQQLVIKDKKSTDIDEGGIRLINNTLGKPDKKNASRTLSEYFSNTEFVEVSVNNLSVENYLHYILGDILAVSYVLGEKVVEGNKSITLNLQKALSKRRLFEISDDALTERGYVLSFEDGIFYIHKEEAGGRRDIEFGYGKSVEDIPSSSAEIVQIVPFEYGVQSQLSLVLQSIAQVKVTLASTQNAFILRGRQREILKAVEFLSLMDQPSYKNRSIGLYQSTYVSTAELTEKLTELLANEGVSVTSAIKPNGAVSIVSLDRIGTTVFFGPNDTVLQRINFWVKQIDQAPNGNELQYFIYHPKYSRASDLGESLKVLISGSSAEVSKSTSANQQNETNERNNTSSGVASAQSEGISLVVDERANALIFYTAGDRYKAMLPLIKRLDVMPKQVILEVMIAEVKLTDVFKQGVDFTLTNQGNANKVGGFALSSGSNGLSYVLSGTDGELTFSLLQTNTNVNVLSRPSLLVRDGVTASINVGDDIPTVGEIITDPTNGSQTSVVYRKTGVELSVKPTINAQGIIIMDINQKISNQSPGDESVAGSPIIFERKIKTEVIAESGQTIVLGGLISENRTLNDRSVPFFSDIPLIGHLFDGTDDTQDKTELVVLVTPKVIESTSEWQEILNKFSSKLTDIDFNL